MSKIEKTCLIPAERLRSVENERGRFKYPLSGLSFAFKALPEVLDILSSLEEGEKCIYRQMLTDTDVKELVQNVLAFDAEALFTQCKRFQDRPDFGDYIALLNMYKSGRIFWGSIHQNMIGDSAVRVSIF